MKQNTEIINSLFNINRYLMFKTMEKHRNGFNVFKGQGKVLSILAILYQSHQVVSQKHLQQHMGIRSQSLGEFLTKLENQGFIERFANPNDKRSMLIKITQAGLDEFDKMNKENEASQASIIDSLSTEEKDQLITLLDKLEANIDEDEMSFGNVEQDYPFFGKIEDTKQARERFFDKNQRPPFFNRNKK